MRPAEKIKELLKKSTITVDPGADDRMLSDVLDRFNRRKRQAGGDRSIWRIIMQSKMTKLTTAAALIVAVLLGMQYFTGSIDGTSPAWADVIQPILNARTAIYTIVVGQQEDAPEIHDMVSGSRIRRMLAGQDTISVIDLAEARVLTLNQEDMFAVYVDLKGLPEMPESYLETLKNKITMLEEHPAFVVEELEMKEINGRMATGFHARCPGAEITIWADAETALPVIIEQKSGQVAVTLKDFQFDADMDPSLFSMEVPQGYEVKQTEIDLFGSTEEDFIEGLRLMAEVIFDGEFPDGIAIEDVVKQAPVMGKKIEALGVSKDEQLEIGLKLQRGILFTRFFKGQGKWHYAGNGVKLGDAETAIFWYRPQGSKKYHVIYGDLTVKEFAPKDMPDSLEVEPIASPDDIGYQQWANPTFVGSQKDFWHVTGPDEILAKSLIMLTKGPEDSTVMPINLPYSSGYLTQATLGDIEIPFDRLAAGRYELHLPAEQLLAGQTKLQCLWTLPLDALEKVDNGYRTVLKSLIPVFSYRLVIVLESGSGFEHSKDPTKQRLTPFSWNSGNATEYFGSCGITIRPSNQ
ncbi:MAG: hypothetical protein KAT00_09200 [Planctomycetes bacterium]|nr:hypothetical protein [Planctomycetota bacterium]